LNTKIHMVVTAPGLQINLDVLKLLLVISTIKTLNAYKTLYRYKISCAYVANLSLRED
jgi:hypothetical protein